MRRFTVPLVVFFVSLLPMCGADEVKPLQHAIVLSAGDGPFTFGQNISLKASYRNLGEDPWMVFFNPLESDRVWLRYALSESKKTSGYCIGCSKSVSIELPNGRKWISKTRVIPKVIPKPFPIEPGKSYDFEIPLERRWTGERIWTGDVAPGRWSVWIEDSGEQMKSNIVEIPLRFTADSIATCLQNVGDEKQELYTRVICAEYLQDIKPDLDLRWPSDPPVWPTEGMSVDERQKVEREIRQKLQAFKVYMDEKGNTQAIETAIRSINKKFHVDER